MILSVSAVQSLLVWLKFIVFSVLPTAFSQFGVWAYQWQPLEAGILAIIAAGIWGHAIVRAAELRTLTPWSFSEEAQSHVRPDAVPAEETIKSDLREAGVPFTQTSSSSVLLGIRARVRTTLGQVPSVDDPLSSQQLKLCQQIGGIDFDPAAFDEDESAKNKAALLQLAMRKLTSLEPGTSCQIAWQALVAVNRCALSLEKSAGIAPSGPKASG